MQTISTTDYRLLLEPWVKAADQYLYTCHDRPDLICYGTGFNSWGVQTNQKAFAGLAVLATDPDYDAAHSGMGRDELLEKALGLLRFSLASHHSGDYHCTDGTQWGHTWISALGVERMMHGVEAIRPHLTEKDLDGLRNMLISESDWLLNEYEIVAGLVKNNKPESNIWNGCILHRTAALYPDAPNAAAYREKGTRFLLNGISVPSDASSEDLFEGRPLRDWHIDANFFPSYALNHHLYLNVGYMVICLSNVAMLHFTYREWGQEAPAALYHHAEDLWKVVKPFIFPDGRLLRIGGDTRVRYCYCQDYAIPSWLMAEDLFDDAECAALEKHWLGIVKHELDWNGDGSYLSTRCGGLASVSPQYYTRLESDRACTLSMGAYWRRVLGLSGEGDEPAPLEDYSWHDEYHGAAMHRSAKRVASWTWLAAERPQGLCLPPDRSDLAEWRENLAGQVHGLGQQNLQHVLEHKEVTFHGGFLTWGRTVVESRQMASEGHPDEGELAFQTLVIAALPDDATVLVMQYAHVGDRRGYFVSVKGIGLRVPNDLFNRNQRTYRAASGTHTLEGAGSTEEIFDLRSRWVNIDESLLLVSVYGTDSLFIYRPGKRQIGLKHQYWVEKLPTGGMFYCDEVCGPCRTGLESFHAGSTLYDCGFLLSTEMGPDAVKTYADSGRASRLTVGDGYLRAMQVEGADGVRYLLVANVAEGPAESKLPGPSVDVATGETLGDAIEIAGRSARLCRLE